MSEQKIREVKEDPIENLQQNPLYLQKYKTFLTGKKSQDFQIVKQKIATKDNNLDISLYYDTCDNPQDFLTTEKWTDISQQNADVSCETYPEYPCDPILVLYDKHVYCYIRRTLFESLIQTRLFEWEEKSDVLTIIQNINTFRTTFYKMPYPSVFVNEYGLQNLRLVHNVYMLKKVGRKFVGTGGQYFVSRIHGEYMDIYTLILVTNEEFYQFMKGDTLSLKRIPKVNRISNIFNNIKYVMKQRQMDLVENKKNLEDALESAKKELENFHPEYELEEEEKLKQKISSIESELQNLQLVYIHKNYHDDFFIKEIGLLLKHSNNKLPSTSIVLEIDKKKFNPIILCRILFFYLDIFHVDIKSILYVMYIGLIFMNLPFMTEYVDNIALSCLVLAYYNRKEYVEQILRFARRKLKKIQPENDIYTCIFSYNISMDLLNSAFRKVTQYMNQYFREEITRKNLYKVFNLLTALFNRNFVNLTAREQFKFLKTHNLDYEKIKCSEEILNKLKTGLEEKYTKNK